MSNANIPKVCVLLSSYNGERYIAEQIDSVLAQTDVEINLLVRDDGSTDGTKEILHRYANQRQLSVIEGSNIGYAKSFWGLICAAPESDYYAFCDQDDIWLPGKLKTALRSIDGIEGPALSTGNVIAVDASGNSLGIELFNEHGPLPLASALQKSILPGCTFVFNKAARDVLARYDGFMESHDWAAYAIVTAFGQVEYVNEPGMMYRLHGDNALGSSNRFDEFKQKIMRFFSTSKCTRSRMAAAILETYGDNLDSESNRIIKELAYYKRGVKNRFRLMTSKNYSGLVFRFYVLLGRV